MKALSHGSAWLHRAWRAAAVSVVLSGCATAPPVQEMSDARQAIAAAREVGAEQHAAAQLSRALEQMGVAERDLQARLYHSARRAAVAAKNAAFDALLTARAAREPGGSAAP